MRPLNFLAGRIETSVVLGAILLVAVLAITTHGQWFASVPSVLRVTAQVGIIAIGQALLMTTGEVDLSVGSVFAIAGVAFIWLMDLTGAGVLPAMLLAVIAAAGIGAINGLITTRFRVPSMIVTLGAMFVFRGLAYLSTQGFSLSIPRSLRRDPLVLWLKGQMFGLNMTVWILAALVVIFIIVLAKTRFGSHVTAVGGNTDAALANGIPTDWVKLRSFMLCSALAGVSGVLIVCQEGSVYATSGVKMELESIAACVIGGCSMRGGLGSIWGPVLGVFVLAALKGGLMMLGAPTSWYIALVGAILVGFLIIARILNQRSGVTV